jgi:hypothetical protein
MMSNEAFLHDPSRTRGSPHHHEPDGCSHQRPRAGRQSDLHRIGDDWARAISFGVFTTPPSPLADGPFSTEDWERSGLAGHDLVVTVERLTVAPGASLPAFVPDVHAPRIFAVAEGVVQSALVSDDTATPARPVSFRRDDVIWFRTLNPGVRRQLRNDVDRPLELLQLTVDVAPSEPVAGGTPIS